MRSTRKNCTNQRTSGKMVDKRKNPKQGYELPGMKRRFTCRVPSLNMYNKQQAYIERLILENQELKDKVNELEECILNMPNNTWAQQLEDDVNRLMELPTVREELELMRTKHTHEGHGVPQK